MPSDNYNGVVIVTIIITQCLWVRELEFFYLCFSIYLNIVFNITKYNRKPEYSKIVSEPIKLKRPYIQDKCKHTKNNQIWFIFFIHINLSQFCSSRCDFRSIFKQEKKNYKYNKMLRVGSFIWGEDRRKKEEKKRDDLNEIRKRN